MPLFAIAHVQQLRNGVVAIRSADFPECEVQCATMQAAREAFSTGLNKRVQQLVEAGEKPRLHSFEELDYAFSLRCSIEMPAPQRQPGTFDTVIAVRVKLPAAIAARLAAMRGDRPRVWRRHGVVSGVAVTRRPHANREPTRDGAATADAVARGFVKPASQQAAPVAQKAGSLVPGQPPGTSGSVPHSVPQQQPYTLRTALQEIQSGLRPNRAAASEEMEARARLAEANAQRLAAVRAARQSRIDSGEGHTTSSAPSSVGEQSVRQPPAARPSPSARLAIVADHLTGRVSGAGKSSRRGLSWKPRVLPAGSPEIEN
jgi:hypothetical protein